MAELVRAQRDELAELEVRDCGKPLADARADIDEVAFMFEYYAGWATKISGDIPPVGPDAMSLVVKEPLGVCGLIVPWNYPMLMAAQKVAPALAAGCTVVLKPAEQTPLTALRLAAIAEEAGVAGRAWSTWSPGFGPEAGAPLLTDPAVDKISFTGSRDVGRADPAHLRRPAQAGHARAGRQEPEHRVRRRRPGRRRAGHLRRRVRQPGRGLLGRVSRVFVERSIYDEVLEAMTAEAGHPARLRARSGHHHGPARVGRAARPGGRVRRDRPWPRVPSLAFEGARRPTRRSPAASSSRPPSSRRRPTTCASPARRSSGR
jgi:hypothetical protein